MRSCCTIADRPKLSAARSRSRVAEGSLAISLVRNLTRAMRSAGLASGRSSGGRRCFWKDGEDGTVH